MERAITEPLTEVEMSALERSVRETADQIIAGFRREGVPTSVALGIVGCVTGHLLDQLPQPMRKPWAKAFRDCLEVGK